jgi:hypothetical protein
MAPALSTIGIAVFVLLVLLIPMPGSGLDSFTASTNSFHAFIG